MASEEIARVNRRKRYGDDQRLVMAGLKPRPTKTERKQENAADLKVAAT